MTISKITLRPCHRCNKDIWRGMFYKSIGKGKVICGDCNKPKQAKSFIIRLLERLR